MGGLGQGLLAVFRVLCYGALVFVLAGFGSLILVSVLDVCPVLNEGGIRCNTPLYQSIAEFGVTAMLLTVFTGLPGLLAMGGAFFLFRGILRWARGRRAPSSS